MTEPFWQDRAAAAARKIIPNKGLQSVAVAMATCKPFALDYIEQAPILVLAASVYRGTRHPVQRNAIAETFSKRIMARPKLRVLMQSYQVAYGFRRLRGSAVAARTGAVVMALSKRDDINPSALAQAIPDSPIMQSRWLHAIETWSAYVARRPIGPVDGVPWALVTAGARARAGDLVVNGHLVFADLADLFRYDTARFDTKWTFDQAVAAMERWHAELAKGQAKAFKEQFTVDYEEEIHTPIPRAFVDEFEIVELNSGKALHEEGASMHHCVASYAVDVIEGRSRIFSVRVDDTRIATFELRIEADRMQLAQLRGPCNAQVDERISRLVSGFVKLVNRPVADLRRAA